MRSEKDWVVLPVYWAVQAPVKRYIPELLHPKLGSILYETPDTVLLAILVLGLMLCLHSKQFLDTQFITLSLLPQLLNNNWPIDEHAALTTWMFIPTDLIMGFILAAKFTNSFSYTVPARVINLIWCWSL